MKHALAIVLAASGCHADMISERTGALGGSGEMTDAGSNADASETCDESSRCAPPGDGLTIQTRCDPGIVQTSDSFTATSLGVVRWTRFDPPVNGAYRVDCRIWFNCTRPQGLRETCPAGSSVARIEPACPTSLLDSALYERTLSVPWKGNNKPNELTAQAACEGEGAAMDAAYKCWYAARNPNQPGVYYNWPRPDAETPFDVTVTCRAIAPPPHDAGSGQ